MAAGTAEIIPADGQRRKESVHEGEAVPQSPAGGTIRNIGSSSLHFVRVIFLTLGNDETWGMTGLPPNYKILYEDRYCRAYDIKIAAQTKEPQHTHHDRVVVSLSGAQLEHILPSGQIQPSTIKTGEVVWRSRLGTYTSDIATWATRISGSSPLSRNNTGQIYSEVPRATNGLQKCFFSSSLLRSVRPMVRSYQRRRSSRTLPEVGPVTGSPSLVSLTAHKPERPTKLIDSHDKPRFRNQRRLPPLQPNRNSTFR